MTTLTCPKCRYGLPEDALDAGQCPQCGFPLDGPLVLDTPAPPATSRRLLLALGVTLLLAAGVAGYAFLDSPAPSAAPLPPSAAPAPTEVAVIPAVNPLVRPEIHVAPLPHGARARGPRFVGADAKTGGSWRGKYGSDGYELAQGPSSAPSYARFFVSSQMDYTWAASTDDTRALQKPGASDRLAACWYDESLFTVDVSLTDGKTHRVSLYFLDWDKLGRSQTVEMLGASTGSVLDTRTVSGFQGGAYLGWDLSGSVRFRVTNTGPSAAVLSGIFFDAPK